MNKEDLSSDMDEDQLQLELKNIKCEGSELFYDESLFSDTNLEEKIDQTAPIKQFLEAAKQENNVKSIEDFTKPAQSEEVPKRPPMSRPKSKPKSPPKKKIDKRRHANSVSVIVRSTEWAEEKKQKILEGQRQKHRNEIKQCSFKPRLNSSINSSKHYNNISNLSSLSIIKQKLTSSENSNTDNIQTAPNTKPLIEKWRQQASMHAMIIKSRIQGKQNNIVPFRAFNRPHYRQSHFNRGIRFNRIMDSDRDSLQPLSKRLEDDEPPSMEQYLCLVEQADSLFLQLKHLKQANWRLLKQIQQ